MEWPLQKKTLGMVGVWHDDNGQIPVLDIHMT